jgi:hypothetical protein
VFGDGSIFRVDASTFSARLGTTGALLELYERRYQQYHREAIVLSSDDRCVCPDDQGEAGDPLCFPRHHR